MATLKAERAFLRAYEESFDSLITAASTLEKTLKDMVAAQGIFVHAVVARPKSIGSLRAKILDKSYKNPEQELADAIGGRVILYDARDVDHVAEQFQRLFSIRKKDSSDRRTKLGLREFGYRSYHLVATLTTAQEGRPELRPLIGRVFEIQIRGILEHAWAEIEHEVVYKAGARFPAPILRRFAGVAAVLELLDHEFQNLMQSELELVPTAITELRARKSWDEKLDVPKMLATLEIEYPDGRTFRSARSAGAPFPARIENRLVLALRRCGILTPRMLRRRLKTQRVSRSLRVFAREEGIRISNLSHFGMIAVTVGAANRSLWNTYFPEFADNQALDAAIDKAYEKL